MQADKVSCVVICSDAANPRVEGKVSDGAAVLAQVLLPRELLVDDVENAAQLCLVPIHAVRNLERRIAVKVPKLPKKGPRPVLKEQPVVDLSTRGPITREEGGVVLLGEVLQDVAALEDGDWFVLEERLVVDEQRDLRVWVALDESRSELIPPDPDEVCIIRHPKLLEHQGDLLAVGRGHAVQLQVVLPDREVLLEARTTRVRVCLGEGAAPGLHPRGVPPAHPVPHGGGGGSPRQDHGPGLRWVVLHHLMQSVGGAHRVCVCVGLLLRVCVCVWICLPLFACPGVWAAGAGLRV
mmetsp:Transcript_23930/g.59086  ORF Transcript_23930/g.59086 Transcript_23930/m.59086 type:complete len:295 (+) Transcript_23930:292-1176(+)